jgi:chromosome segregation ATPase
MADFEKKYVRSVKALLLLSTQTSRSSNTHLDKRLRKLELDVNDNAVHRNSIVQYYKNREAQHVADMENLVRCIAEQKQQLSDLTSATHAQNTELQLARQACGEKDALLQSQLSLLETQAAELEAWKGKHAGLEQQATEQRGNLQTQRVSLRTAQQQHKELMEVFQDLERERTSLLSQQEAVEEDNAELKATIKTLLYRVEHMQSQLVLTDSGKDTAIYMLQAKCSALAKENAALRKLAEDEVDAQRRLHQEVSSLEKQLRTNSLASAQSQSRPLRRNNSRTQSQTHTTSSSSPSSSSSSSSAKKRLVSSTLRRSKGGISVKKTNPSVRKQTARKLTTR